MIFPALEDALLDRRLPWVNGEPWAGGPLPVDEWLFIEYLLRVAETERRAETPTMEA